MSLFIQVGEFADQRPRLQRDAPSNGGTIDFGSIREVSCGPVGSRRRNGEVSHSRLPAGPGSEALIHESSLGLRGLWTDMMEKLVEEVGRCEAREGRPMSFFTKIATVPFSCFSLNGDVSEEESSPRSKSRCAVVLFGQTSSWARKLWARHPPPNDGDLGELRFGMGNLRGYGGGNAPGAHRLTEIRLRVATWRVTV